MLTATLDGLIARFSLQGERLGEVVAGAVLKHSRDFNLTREAVLGSALDHTTPAYDVQQACDTSLETTALVANKIALGQIESGIAGGVDTTSDAPVEINDDLRRVLMDFNAREERRRAREAARPSAPRPDRAGDPAQRRSRAPGCRWASTPRSPRSEWRYHAHRRRTSWPPRATATSPPPTTAASSTDLITPYLGLERDQNLRPDSSPEKLAKLAACLRRERRRRDDDRRQLHAALRRRRRGAARERRVGGRSQPAGAGALRGRRGRTRSTTCTARTGC